MEEYRSKRTGEQIDDLLDIVSQGGAGGGGGETDLWIKEEGEGGVRLNGTNGTATGVSAISAGDDKTASDGTFFSSAASGDHAVAFGFGNTCAGRSTLAQGLYNIVNGKDSVAFGQRNSVNGDQAFAAGQLNEVATRLGVTIGYKNKAENTNSIAIGYQNTSSGSGSVALGDTCESSGTSSTAMGYKTKATGAYSATFGENTQATNNGEVAMGSYNKSTTSTDASEQTAFSFGIGTSDTDRTNALEIKKNGDVYIGDKSLSKVATSGSYNDLSDKPTILQGEKGDKGDTGAAGANGKDGADGENGATFTPSVDANGNLSWTNDKGLPNPATINIKGEKGDKGDSGEGGGGSANYPIVEIDADISLELQPNTYYVVYPVLGTFEVAFSFAPAIEGVVSEYIFEWRNENGGGAQLIFPDSIVWANQDIPTFSADVTIVSIVNNLAVYLEF